MMCRKRKKTAAAGDRKLAGWLSRESNKADVGKTFKVLIEGVSKKSDAHWMGAIRKTKCWCFQKRGCRAAAG
jgi:hypothetical protein